jgi:hypothetical protein
MPHLLTLRLAPDLAVPAYAGYLPTPAVTRLWRATHRAVRTLLEAGQLPSVRRIRRELHLGQPKAQEVRVALAAELNGHGPG